jgi:hypothetical protein
MRKLEVDLYLSTILSFGTEGGEQIYNKVALLIRFKIRYNLGVTQRRSGPADAKTRTIPIIVLSTMWLRHYSDWAIPAYSHVYLIWVVLSEMLYFQPTAYKRVLLLIKYSRRSKIHAHERVPFWQANSSSACNWIPHVLSNTDIQCIFHKVIDLSQFTSRLSRSTTLHSMLPTITLPSLLLLHQQSLCPVYFFTNNHFAQSTSPSPTRCNHTG